MWCLETIVAINTELASGKSLDEAYAACGIRPVNREQIEAYIREQSKEKPASDMRVPLPVIKREVA